MGGGARRLPTPPDPAPVKAAPTSPVDALQIERNPALQTLQDLYIGLLDRLPLIVGAAMVGAMAVVVALVLTRGVRHGLAASRADPVAVGMVTRIVRILLLTLALLLALALAGVPVGNVLAGLAVAGVAVGLAVQSILENFIAGLILLLRKPFRAGDQIIAAGGLEGTVEDIDLRVTRLLDYDGEVILIPNRDVFANALTNLTRRGSRRTRVTVGVDYRNDHDAARAVIARAVAAVEGVLPEPPVEVLLTELGDSSVNFEVCYWSLPDIATVRRTQDRVLSAAKRGIQDAGMTIPWPIRTLVMDEQPVRFRADSAGGERAG